MAIVAVLVRSFRSSPTLLRISFWGGDVEEGGNQLFMILELLVRILAPDHRCCLATSHLPSSCEFLYRPSSGALHLETQMVARALEKISSDDEGMQRVSSATAPLIS